MTKGPYYTLVMNEYTNLHKNYKFKPGENVVTIVEIFTDLLSKIDAMENLPTPKEGEVKMKFKMSDLRGNYRWKCECGAEYDGYVTFCRDGCKKKNISNA